jgi:CDP-glucose 4,6-dehydratase
MAFNSIYRGKKIFITGNTGFKGSWLSTWLIMMGADVYGYSINVPTDPAMFQIINLESKIHHIVGDIRDKESLNKCIQQIHPNFIFHLAAQAIVSTSYKEPFNTITTNVVGTASVLEAMRNITWNCVGVIITSDKAYDNVEWIWGYREKDRLGGKDIYSGSKGAAELTIKCYWESFIKSMSNIKMGVARAGNVIGGGDWAKDRIVVDCIKSFSKNQIVEIRCPKATRPWQHVLEPLSGYLTLGQCLFENKVENGEIFNFGPRAEQNKTVFELAQDIAKQWDLNADKLVQIIDAIPFKEAALLKLNCDKSSGYLNWHSTLQYEQCVKLIADWYRAYYSNKNDNLYDLTTKQIDFYINKAKEQNIAWSE